MKAHITKKEAVDVLHTLGMGIDSGAVSDNGKEVVFVVRCLCLWPDLANQFGWILAIPEVKLLKLKHEAEIIKMVENYKFRR